MKFSVDQPQVDIERTVDVLIESYALSRLVDTIGLLKNPDGSFGLSKLEYGSEQPRNLTPENLFENHPLIKPDGVLRPVGSTTIFTTAGVQYIETLEKENNSLTREAFQVAQPVVRSQYMDKIVDGLSTSFINYSVVSTQSSPEEFSSLFKTLVRLSLQRDQELSNYRVSIEEVDDKWGSKKFKKTVFTVLYKEKEVSEGVLMQDYTTADGSSMHVSDICFGEERFDWAHADGGEKVYFKGFEEQYKVSDPDTVARLIDPIRTATLMAMLGVVPDHKDPGFRLRQLIKRFFERNRTFKVSHVDLAETAFAFWFSKDVVASCDRETVVEILSKELERAHNVYIMTEVEKRIGRKIKVDVNKRNEDFIATIFSSASRDVIEAVKEIIE